MNCPKCRQGEVRQHLPAAALANACSHCGWLELTSVALSSAPSASERAMHIEEPLNPRTPSSDPALHTCFLCGKNRERLNSEKTRLILGVYGGICARCVQLASGVLQEETAKTSMP